ncbi:hypothetical protein C5167_003135 [Papaver somniferum]|uniref:Uncharacterized protein n=1 Tax=Papaver somniferum TaxID=3469 RepID=A0A4Y7L2Q7_PAPSO|nr:hypothetical protein C5167_003135 [Papaver somniferum]
MTTKVPSQTFFWPTDRNFADAEKMLTSALTKAEEHFGSRHPKVGVVLTCIALMARHKAKLEHSSSILMQEVQIVIGQKYKMKSPPGTL